ncbi:MAG: DUF4118 domain-containing protein, partial [Acidobacteriota bacterium]
MRSVRPYAIAFFVTAAATALTALIWPANRGVVVALFYPAVMASAVYGSRRSAVLAIVLSALSCAYFFLPPYSAFALTVEGLYVLIIFAIVSGALVLLIE